MLLKKSGYHRRITVLHSQWFPVWCTHIKDIQIVVDQVLHNLHLMFTLPICLEKTGGKEQRQVLGAHLVQVCALLHSEANKQKQLLLKTSEQLLCSDCRCWPLSRTRLYR